MMSGVPVKWYVLYCNRDDSHVLLTETSLIFDEGTLSVGQEVNFFYPGVKRMLKGTVKGFSEDFDEMETFMNKLNSETKPKRDASFHEDRPRAAAVKCKAIGFKPISGPSRQAKATDSKSSRGLTSFKVSGPAVKVKNNSTGASSPGHSSSKVTGPTVKGKNSSTGSSPSCGNPKGNTQKIKNGSEGNALKITKVSPPVMSDDYNSESSDTSDSDTGPKADAKEKPKNCLSNSPLIPGEIFQKSNENEPPETTDEDDSNSDESLTSEEIALLKKLAAKKKSSDLKSLLSYNERKKDIGSSTLTTGRSFPLKVSDSNADSRETVSTVKSNSDGSSTAPASDELLNASTSNTGTKATVVVKGLKSVKALKAAAKRKRQVNTVNTCTYDGEFFNYTAESPKVTKLVPDFDVYVSEKELKSIKRIRTPTALARALLREVFTKEARMECSVSGKAHKGPDGKFTIRPSLDQEGVEAILEYVSSRCAKKKWDKVPDSTVKQAMGNLLSEDRLSAKLLAEATAEAEDEIETH